MSFLRPRALLASLLSIVGFGRPAAQERFKLSEPIKPKAPRIYSIYGLGTAPQQGGNAPADWGRSIYCHRMRRKNKHRALGIAGAKC